MRTPRVTRLRREHLHLLLVELEKDPTVSPGQLAWLRKKFTGLKLSGAVMPTVTGSSRTQTSQNQ